MNRPLPLISRRKAIAMAGGLACVPLASAREVPMRRQIPGHDESLPVVGLGTWQSFDVPAAGADYQAAHTTLREFLESGGQVIDSSPMYGRSEERVGDMLASLRGTGRPYLATKIWTRGREAGLAQLADSHRLLRAPVLDLVQVHNLLDLDAHLATLRAAREAGRVRHIGVTHYTASAHAELARVIQRERVDFLQVNYSLAEPEAGEQLLPLARDLGVGVLVNRPFTSGGMIRRAVGKDLPPVAHELGCESAAQLFIKWVLGNPAVTVILAATRNPRHAAENLRAASGPAPDASQRAQIQGWFRRL